ncbi:MAG: hypothetical protein IT461_03460 [Planctomycetes bacterium]|nr:hypothetical protein [Planctomycetota bacterium]
MTQDDTFLSRLKAPAPPSAVDETVLAAAQEAASRLKAGNVGRPEAVVGAKKSYDGVTKGKAGAGSGAGESAMDSIVFPCPACGTKYSVPTQHAGKTTPCKKCGANITVPAPQVANPTIIGGTRTIRRSDIEDASTSERAAPVMKKATAPVPKPGMKKATANFGDVDMKGGDSVLRKEETVVQTHPPARGPASRVPPPPARGGPRPVPGGRPAPMPGQPGFGAPKAKNPMPLYLGIGGGVAVVIIIIIVIAMNAGGNTPSNSVAKDGNKDSGKDGGQPQISDDEKILKQFENDSRNEIGMQTAAVRENYKIAKEKAAAGGEFADKFKDYKNQFAQLLGRRLSESGANKKDVRDVGIMLHGDGYTDIARPLLEQARKMMGSEDRYRTVTEEVTGADGQPTTRKKSVIRDDYKQICDILGYALYTWPEEEFNDYYIWELAEYNPWEQKRQQLMSENGDDLFFTQAQIKEIKVLEDALTKAGQELRAQDKKDGFAIQARRAFNRFRKNNQGGNYADFSPAVLGREGEKFDDVWDYTYWKPFIVYVEKAPGRTATELRKDFATKANLLSRLAEWFKKNLKEKFDLKRVLPLDGDTVIRDGPLAGKKFATAGELAEAEGWPLEVNVLKDGQTFQLFLEAKMGGGIPGARAFYSNTLKHVVTWDDPRAVENDDQAWFNESVLIHECFHMLSDHYAAKPIPWDFKKERDGEGVRRKVYFPREERARYYNLLIQEGLTDSIAGFAKKSDAEDTEYYFIVNNRVRIKDWQGIYKQFDNNNIFRIRDLLDCVHYGHFTPVGNRGFERIGMRKKHGGYLRDYGAIYYAAACQASAFFYHYKVNGTLKYRDKWLDYVKKNYTGAIELTNFSPEPGIKMFKECFGISKDEDFDKMEAELVKWTLELQPDGSDGLMEKDDDAIGDAPDVPAPGSYAPRSNEQWATLREEEALA